jgi:hypothetical protein
MPTTESHNEDGGKVIAFPAPTIEHPAEPAPAVGDCSKIGVSGPTRRTEVRRDGHCE